MRQGIPAAGNFLHQELAIMTGAVEAMVVDVQCIMQALCPGQHFHTKVITTSPKVRSPARCIWSLTSTTPWRSPNILRSAVDNYKNRGAIHIPDIREDLVPGFSQEYINYMLGGTLPRIFPPAERRHHDRAHPRSCGDCGLQQSAQQPGLHA